MKKNGLEQNLMVILFVLVLVMFSFAEKESKKMERFYTVAQLLKKNTLSPIAAAPTRPAMK